MIESMIVVTMLAIPLEITKDGGFLIGSHSESLDSGIYRFEDKEKNVTCWFGYTDSAQYGAGIRGISCIPNTQLKKESK